MTMNFQMVIKESWSISNMRNRRKKISKLCYIASMKILKSSKTWWLQRLTMVIGTIISKGKKIFCTHSIINPNHKLLKTLRACLVLPLTIALLASKANNHMWAHFFNEGHNPVLNLGSPIFNCFVLTLGFNLLLFSILCCV